MEVLCKKTILSACGTIILLGKLIFGLDLLPETKKEDEKYLKLMLEGMELGGTTLSETTTVNEELGKVNKFFNELPSVEFNKSEIVKDGGQDFFKKRSDYFDNLKQVKETPSTAVTYYKTFVIEDATNKPENETKHPNPKNDDRQTKEAAIAENARRNPNVASATSGPIETTKNHNKNVATTNKLDKTAKVVFNKVRQYFDKHYESLEEIEGQFKAHHGEFEHTGAGANGLEDDKDPDLKGPEKLTGRAPVGFPKTPRQGWKLNTISVVSNDQQIWFSNDTAISKLNGQRNRRSAVKNFRSVLYPKNTRTPFPTTTTVKSTKSRGDLRKSADTLGFDYAMPELPDPGGPHGLEHLGMDIRAGHSRPGLRAGPLPPAPSLTGPGFGPSGPSGMGLGAPRGVGPGAEYGPGAPRFGPGGPGFGPGGPQLGPGGPGFGPSGPGFGSGGPGFGPDETGFGPSGPGLGPGAPRFGSGGPGFGSDGPGFGPGGPGFGSGKPGFGPSGPGFGPEAPRFGPGGPGFGPSGNGIGPTEPGFGPGPPGFRPSVPGFGPETLRFGPGGPGVGPSGPGLGPEAPRFGPGGPGFELSGHGFGPGGQNGPRVGPGIQNGPQLGPGGGVGGRNELGGQIPAYSPGGPNRPALRPNGPYVPGMKSGQNAPVFGQNGPGVGQVAQNGGLGPAGPGFAPNGAPFSFNPRQPVGSVNGNSRPFNGLPNGGLFNGLLNGPPNGPPPSPLNPRPGQAGPLKSPGMYNPAGLIEKYMPDGPSGSSSEKDRWSGAPMKKADPRERFKPGADFGSMGSAWGQVQGPQHQRPTGPNQIQSARNQGDQTPKTPGNRKPGSLGSSSLGIQGSLPGRPAGGPDNPPSVGQQVRTGYYRQAGPDYNLRQAPGYYPPPNEGYRPPLQPTPPGGPGYPPQAGQGPYPEVDTGTGMRPPWEMQPAPNPPGQTPGVYDPNRPMGDQMDYYTFVTLPPGLLNKLTKSTTVPPGAPLPWFPGATMPSLPDPNATATVPTTTTSSTTPMPTEPTEIDPHHFPDGSPDVGQMTVTQKIMQATTESFQVRKARVLALLPPEFALKGPITLDAIANMGVKEHGMFTEGMYQFLLIMAKKPLEAAKKIFKEFNRYARWSRREERIPRLGEPATSIYYETLMEHYIVPTDRLQATAARYYHAILDKERLGPDINALLQFADLAYQDQDIADVLGNLEFLNAYPDNNMDPYQIVHDLVEHLIVVPYNRLRGSMKELVFSEALNRILSRVRFGDDNHWSIPAPINNWNTWGRRDGEKKRDPSKYTDTMSQLRQIIENWNHSKNLNITGLSRRKLYEINIDNTIGQDYSTNARKAVKPWKTAMETVKRIVKHLDRHGYKRQKDKIKVNFRHSKVRQGKQKKDPLNTHDEESTIREIKAEGSNVEKKEPRHVRTKHARSKHFKKKALHKIGDESTEQEENQDLELQKWKNYEEMAVQEGGQKSMEAKNIKNNFNNKNFQSTTRSISVRHITNPVKRYAIKTNVPPTGLKTNLEQKKWKQKYSGPRLNRNKKLHSLNQETPAMPDTMMPFVPLKPNILVEADYRLKPKSSHIKSKRNHTKPKTHFMKANRVRLGPQRLELGPGDNALQVHRLNREMPSYPGLQYTDNKTYDDMTMLTEPQGDYEKNLKENEIIAKYLRNKKETEKSRNEIMKLAGTKKDAELLIKKGASKEQSRHENSDSENKVEKTQEKQDFKKNTKNNSKEMDENVLEKLNNLKSNINKAVETNIDKEIEKTLEKAVQLHKEIKSVEAIAKKLNNANKIISQEMEDQKAKRKSKGSGKGKKHKKKNKIHKLMNKLFKEKRKHKNHEKKLQHLRWNHPKIYDKYIKRHGKHDKREIRRHHHKYEKFLNEKKSRHKQIEASKSGHGKNKNHKHKQKEYGHDNENEDTFIMRARKHSKDNESTELYVESDNNDVSLRAIKKDDKIISNTPRKPPKSENIKRFGNTMPEISKRIKVVVNSRQNEKPETIKTKEANSIDIEIDILRENPTQATMSKKIRFAVVNSLKGDKGEGERENKYENEKQYKLTMSRFKKVIRNEAKAKNVDESPSNGNSPEKSSSSEELEKFVKVPSDEADKNKPNLESDTPLTEVNANEEDIEFMTAKTELFVDVTENSVSNSENFEHKNMLRFNADDNTQPRLGMDEGDKSDAREEISKEANFEVGAMKMLNNQEYYDYNYYQTRKHNKPLHISNHTNVNSPYRRASGNITEKLKIIEESHERKHDKIKRAHEDNAIAQKAKRRPINITHSSSGSDEEHVLKQKIYKHMGFADELSVDLTHDIHRRTNGSESLVESVKKNAALMKAFDKKLTPKKISIRYESPEVNEEEVLRDKLKMFL